MLRYLFDLFHAFRLSGRGCLNETDSLTVVYKPIWISGTDWFYYSLTYTLFLSSLFLKSVFHPIWRFFGYKCYSPAVFLHIFLITRDFPVFHTPPLSWFCFGDHTPIPHTIIPLTFFKIDVKKCKSRNLCIFYSIHSTGTIPFSRFIKASSDSAVLDVSVIAYLPSFQI